MNDALIPVVVVERHEETADICSLRLEHAEGGTLPPFSPGAHLDVHLPGAGRLVRQYSLCNAPGESGSYRIGVLRDRQSRGGSAWIHAQAVLGTHLMVSAPRNRFPLQAGNAPVLLLAGGVGITPLIVMAERLAAHGTAFRLAYCTRTRADVAFAARLRAPALEGRVQLLPDSESATGRVDFPALLADCAPDTELYVCGPAGFIDAALATAGSQAWPQARLHFERFTASSAAEDTRGAPAFRLRLARSGRSLEIPAGRTVVSVLADAGVEVLTSCEQGVCGTCLTTVLAGTPDHRDSYLTDEEKAAGDCFLPCCSRARSAELVIDL